MKNDWIRCEILKTISKSDGLHVVELAAKIDRHPVTVDRACGRLHDDGYLYSYERGRYRLTDCGQQQLTTDCNGGTTL